MTVTTSKNTTVTFNLNETEMNAIETVTRLFDRLSEAVIDNYSDEVCNIWDADNDIPINVPSDELGIIAMHLEEFNGTKLIKLLPA